MKKVRKYMCLLLAALMCVSLLPTAAFATGVNQNTGNEQGSVDDLTFEVKFTVHDTDTTAAAAEVQKYIREGTELVSKQNSSTVYSGPAKSKSTGAYSATETLTFSGVIGGTTWADYTVRAPHTSGSGYVNLSTPSSFTYDETAQTLTAEYIFYAVTFHNEGGTTEKVYVAKDGTATNDKDQVRENYTFKGWSTTENATEGKPLSELPITGITELYPVFAEENTPTPYDLWVDGVQVTSANADNVLNKTNGDGEPTVSFDATNNTLTLNGATITNIYEEYPSGIYSGLENLTLNLIGDNTIDFPDSSSGAGLGIEGNLIVEGSGSLTATVPYGNGVGVVGNLTVNSGTLIVTGADIDNKGMEGIVVGGNLTVNGGSVTGKRTGNSSLSCGVRVYGTLLVEGGSVTGEADYYGIIANGGLIVKGGSITGRAVSDHVGLLDDGVGIAAVSFFKVTNPNAKITAQGTMSAIAVVYTDYAIDKELQLPEGYLPAIYKTLRGNISEVEYVWIAPSDAPNPEEVYQGAVKELSLPAHMHGTTPFMPLPQTSGDLPGGNYYLDKDIDLTGNLNIGNNVTLCLNGKTLTGGNYGITVSNSAPVTICDCSEKKDGTIMANVSVSGGKLTLESGKIVTGEYIPGVQINSGTFDMKGGEVAAVSALGGSFNLSGGTVRDNGNSITSPIIIANSNTNITGGTVITWRDKPVIVAKSGTVTISGGYFVTKEGTPFFDGCAAEGGYYSHEPATSDIKENYEAYDAGIQHEGREYSHMIAHKDAHCHNGIVFEEGKGNGSSFYLTADSASIRLTDGATYNICLGGKTVSDGIALLDNTAVNLYGCPLAQNPGSVGDVFVWNGATLNLYSGSIGCVNVINGTFTLHGGIFDSSRNGNVLLQGGKVFYIGEDFDPTPGTQISVKIPRGVTPTESNPVAITGENTRDYSEYFVSADDSYRVINGANNVLYLVPRTALTITANSASKDYDGAALTDNGFKLTYNGEEYPSSENTGAQTASFTVGETTYTVTAVVSGSATNVSDTSTGNNTITAWSISDSNGLVQSSTSTGGNLPFVVSTAAGSLTINKAQRQLTITVKNQEYDYDGTAKGAPNDTITDNFEKYVEVEGLAAGDTLTSLTILGQRTDAGEYTGVLVASNAAISSTNYDYTVQYVAGNLVINADETAPTGTITVSSKAWERSESWDSPQSEISFDKFSNKKYTVSIAANDSGSGVASFGYLISNAKISDEELSKRTDWISYTDPFELSADGKYIIYAKITDNSNNVTYISTQGLVLDTVDPEIDGVEDMKTYCKEVSFTVKDANLDRVLVDGEPITANADGVYNITPNSSDFYIIKAVDKAGNETEIDIEINTNHTYGAFVSNNNATCTADGTKTAQCLYCDATDTITDSGTALGHDEVYHDAQAATCTAIGWDEYETCSRCDYSTYEEIAALGHDEETHDAQAATCTAIGWNEYVTCSRCDYSTYEEIAALGHDEETHDAQAATCTEIGWNEYVTCSRCDYTTYEEIPALGHYWNKVSYNWSEDGSSCTAERVCKNDNQHTETENADITNEVTKEATCTEKGETTYTAVFTEKWAQSEPAQTKTIANIPVKGHSYVDGECTVCGDKENTSTADGQSQGDNGGNTGSDTGDKSNTAPWIVLMLTALAGAGSTAFYSRRKRAK